MPSNPSQTLYERIAGQLINMGSAAFGNASYGPPTNDDKSPDFFRTVNNNKNNSYIWNRDGSEFSTIIFGQLMSSSYGTIHSAKGNHYGANGDVSKINSFKRH